jgi:hypothetical protein
MRLNDWKIVFYEQRSEGFDVWQDPFTRLRLPKIFNLRRDPFEKASYESSMYDKWRLDRTFILTPAQVKTYEFLRTFRDFPPRQVPPSFSIDVDINDIVEKCGLALDEAADPNANWGTCYYTEDLDGLSPPSKDGKSKIRRRLTPKNLRLPGFGG